MSVVSGTGPGPGGDRFTVTFPAAEQFVFFANRWSLPPTSRQTDRLYMPDTAVAGTFTANLIFVDFAPPSRGTDTRCRVVSGPLDWSLQLSAASVAATRIRVRFATVAVPATRPLESLNDALRTTSGSGLDFAFATCSSAAGVPAATRPTTAMQKSSEAANAQRRRLVLPRKARTSGRSRATKNHLHENPQTPQATHQTRTTPDFSKTSIGLAAVGVQPRSKVSSGIALARVFE